MIASQLHWQAVSVTDVQTSYTFSDNRDRLALAEARLVTAKLIWNFDMELDGDHDTWVEDARFYVSCKHTH